MLRLQVEGGCYNCLLRLLAGFVFGFQNDGSFGRATLGRIPESLSVTIRLRRLELEGLLHLLWQSADPCLAIDIGSDLEVQLVGAQESVRNVHPDPGVIHRRVAGVGDCEFDRTGADIAIDCGYSMGVRSRVGPHKSRDLQPGERQLPP